MPQVCTNVSEFRHSLLAGCSAAFSLGRDGCEERPGRQRVADRECREETESPAKLIAIGRSLQGEETTFRHIQRERPSGMRRGHKAYGSRPHQDRNLEPAANKKHRREHFQGGRRIPRLREALSN